MLRGLGETVRERVIDPLQGITQEKLSAIGGGAVGSFMETVDAEVSVMTPEYVEARLSELKAGMPLEAAPVSVAPKQNPVPAPVPQPGPIIPPRPN